MKPADHQEQAQDQNKREISAQQPERVQRPHRRQKGRLVPVKRPDSRRIAMAKKVNPVAPGWSRRVTKATLDGRGLFFKAVRRRMAVTEAFYNGTEGLTPPKRSFLEHESALDTVWRIAYGDVVDRGLIVEGQLNPSFDVLIRAGRDQRSILSELGLERVVEVPDLATYFREKERAEGQSDG